MLKFGRYDAIRKSDFCCPETQGSDLIQGYSVSFPKAQNSYVALLCCLYRIGNRFHSACHRGGPSARRRELVSGENPVENWLPDPARVAEQAQPKDVDFAQPKPTERWAEEWRSCWRFLSSGQAGSPVERFRGGRRRSVASTGKRQEHRDGCFWRWAKRWKDGTYCTSSGRARCLDGENPKEERGDQ